jgi:ABC-2 type transport system ATP-binding protein
LAWSNAIRTIADCVAATNADRAIDLHQVMKIYPKRVHALRGIDLQVGRGEIFGLLGPNGAGKSTLVKIIMTVVRPTRAQGSVLDHPMGHKPTLARIGYLPEKHCFPRSLTGR